METSDIIRQIAEAEPAKDKIIMATITDISNSENLSKKIIGEKIIFYERGDIFSSLQDQSLLDAIKQNLNFNNAFYEMGKADIEKIQLNQADEIELFFEAVTHNPRLIIFGSGHVAQPVAKIAKISGFSVNVIDDRAGLLTKNYFPTADRLICQEYVEYLKNFKLRSNDYLVIVTRGHQYDYDVLKGAIDSQVRYIGMIGSKRKVNLTFERLKEEEDVSQDEIDKIDAPIGINIGSETPAEIAISIMSKIISVRRGRDET
jgi:xanthine dehydrogenase accessory factor